MILPLNKYNLEDLSNTKIYKNISELGKSTLSTLDFQKYYPLTQIFAWKTINRLRKISKNHTLLDQFYMNLIPHLRTYSAGLWKKDPIFTWIFGPHLDIQVPPSPGVAAKMTSSIWYCFVFWLLRQYLSTNGVEGEITPMLYTVIPLQQCSFFFKRRGHGEAGYAALDVYSKQAECWVCFPCIRPTTAHSNHWTLKRSQLCPIAQQYSPHVIDITGYNFIPVLISALLRI